MATFLLAFGALFSIVNPLSGAFIFFGATQGMEPKTRAAVSRWVSIYAFCIVAASLYVGAYVLSFFGISIPVLRVAGGIIVSMSGWRMLNEPDATEQRRSEAPAYPRSIDTPPSRLAFYPLTMPLDHRPGHHLGGHLHRREQARRGSYASLIAFFMETLAATLLLVLLDIRLLPQLRAPRGSHRPTGTTIVVRLSAFLLFCIGIQVFWNGAGELLAHLPVGPTSG